MIHTLLLASGNLKKRQELETILAGLPITLLTPEDLDIQALVEETGTTFEENAVIKATTYSALSGMMALADDSGIVVDALNGEPGVYSARYGGVGLDDEGRTRLLLERLGETPPARRTARFVAVIAIALDGLPLATFHGVVEGTIGFEPRGAGGFGYDPVFIPLGETRTTAEMSAAEKHAISHRGKALRQARGWLERYLAQAEEAAK